MVDFVKLARISREARDAADQWGDKHDPCRGDFITGFKDYLDGHKPNPPTTMDRAAAYNSGYVAAREG